MQAPTSDQLRSRIDSGQTGEKVAMPDPAAAPLGTDAEAAGAPPTVQERALDARQSPEFTPRPPAPGPLIYLALILTVAAAIVVITVLALG